jgi:hypothetical protein
VISNALLVFFGVLALGIFLWRFAFGGDRTGIREKVESEGGKVIWIKQLDSQGQFRWLAGLDGVTNYDVLVEREGARKIEVWRCTAGGASRDH